MNHVRSNVSGIVFGSVVRADSVGGVHLTAHRHGHMTHNASPAGVAAGETVIQIAGQTFSGWDDVATAYATRSTGDHDASASADDSERAPEADSGDRHAECWGAHSGPFGPVDCDGREF